LERTGRIIIFEINMKVNLCFHTQTQPRERDTVMRKTVEAISFSFSFFFFLLLQSRKNVDRPGRRRTTLDGGDFSLDQTQTSFKLVSTFGCKVNKQFA